MSFQDHIVDVLEHEGGFVDDPDDKGGMTKYGISKRSYPDVDIENLTKAEAVQIYYEIIGNQVRLIILMMIFRILILIWW